MKAHIRWLVNEKHDVTTAEDMKATLESQRELKGCRAAAVQADVDSSKELFSNKIPGISLYFEENGIRVWKAYDIGPGRFFSYKDIHVQPQSGTVLKVIQPFGPRVKKLGSTRDGPVPRTETFSCNDISCVATFKTQNQADAHTLFLS